jgi:Ferritin-like domain
VRAEPTRRALLGAGATASVLLAGSLAGCKGIAALGSPPQAGPDVAILDHAIVAEELMIARYHAALTALTSDAAVAATARHLLAEHEQHLAALRSRLVLPQRLATASPRPSPTPPPLPAGSRGVLAALADAESVASAGLIHQLRQVPAPLAQLMASIAASEASHVVVLHEARLA